SEDHYVYKFPVGCRSDGGLCSLRVLFSADLGGPLWSTPAAAGGRLYVPSHDGHVYGLRADSLETVWSVPVSSITDIESPIVANGQFYMYSGGSLSAFRAVNEYR